MPEPGDNPRIISRRSLVKAALAAALPAAIVETARPDAIRRENNRPGTRAWLLERTRVDPASRCRSPWIEGYCSRASLRAGETLRIFCSTNPPSPFRVDIYRMGYYGGYGGRQVHALGPLRGRVQPDPPVGKRRLCECRWEPCAELRIPDDWLSGVYLGKLTAEREGLQSYVVFIVRDARPADFTFQCSDTTWQAYNRWPGRFSLYDNGVKEWYWGPGVEVSFARPYGKYRQIVDAPLSTGSGEWFLWEFPLAYWLESRGYDVTYVSNLDTHADSAGLLRARAFLSVGHDEYYSLEMFRNVKDAIARGVHVGFLSGNTCCGRIELAAHHRFSRVDVFGPPEPADIRRFPDMGLLPHRSPNANTLVGARSVAPITGGADWICALPEHWLFAGTGMKQGDGIEGLVGWEWHGDPAPIEGLEVVSTGTTASPAGTGTYTATIYPGPKGNFVFNASTCWWGDGLAAPPGYVRPSVYTSPRGPDPRVERITANLLERMRVAR